MNTMRALRFIAAGHAPEMMNVPIPTPGPGEVLIRIGGAGVCHSDLHLLDRQMPGIVGPFTLGHENAGFVAKLGAGVKGLKEGDAVAVYGPWGCGRCHACLLSQENYCEAAAPEVLQLCGGIGLDGGMAEYMLVPHARFLVPLGTMQPRFAAPLTDAALTPYHAIKRALPWLTPESTTLVIGIGGLGHMAVQLLRALSPTRVIAADTDDTKLNHARGLGAEYTVNTHDRQAAQSIRAIAGMQGVTFVLDCVGTDTTLALGARVVRKSGLFTVVGLGGGTLAFEQGALPWGVSLSMPFWGTRAELVEVIELAHNDLIRVETHFFPLEQAKYVLHELRSGSFTGRAVLVPSEPSVGLV